MSIIRSDKQAAADYITYMIGASLFHHAVCVTPNAEQKLALRYRLSGSEFQYRKEEECIRFFEGKLLGELPEKFVSGDVRVKIFLSGEGSVVLFQGTGYALAVCNRLGRGGGIRYRIFYPSRAAYRSEPTGF